MKNHRSDNIKTGIILCIVIILTKMIEAIPWWGFVVPVFSLGIIITLKNWEVSCFRVGFLGGFLTLFWANLFFHLVFNGRIIIKLGPIPGMIIWVASGLIGGLLAGLALYSGKIMVFDKKARLSL